MARSICCLLIVAAGILSFDARAVAQSPVLAELYGRGVHAFYSGNMLDAHRYLSMAIDNGSKDPRAYYFRGVVNASTGRQSEAKVDWQAAANLEAQGEYGIGIGRALQRIQGSMRMEIENIRQVVRLEQRASQSARNRARYEDLKAAESQVLRGGKPQPKSVAPALPADDDNPFASDPGEAVPDEQNNPFADDPGSPAMPAEPAGAADPFGGGSPAAPAADPFGGGAPAAPAADPFGGGAPAAPAADPFGGGASPAAPKTPAPAAGGSDPFGSGDPFGGGDPFGT